MNIEDNLNEFFKEIVSFQVEVQDRILIELTKNPYHNIEFDQLKKSVSPENTQGDAIDNPFSTAVNILRANEFVEIEGGNVKLGKEGYKLFELLSTVDELSKPYTTYIQKEQKRYSKANELLENQIENVKEQKLLNQSIIETNRISVVTNKYIAGFTFIAAIYYAYEFLKDVIPNSNTCKSDMTILILLFLVCIGIVGYRKINRGK